MYTFERHVAPRQNPGPTTATTAAHATTVAGTFLLIELGAWDVRRASEPFFFHLGISKIYIIASGCPD